MNILNSSMLMFFKIKSLIERASKISRGRTMVDIYKCIKENVNKYT